MKTQFLIALLGFFVVSIQAFWLEDIAHQGNAPYAGSGYTVFRNVKDYGAKGDGVTDDTEAINNAIADGNRCGKDCASTTTTPAIVYFPAGTYLLSSSIIQFYITQLIGDATNPPTLKATASFQGLGLIDGNPYYTEDLNWVSTNVFYRQVRNFVVDTTNIPAGNAATGIHWPSSQATSLQNIHFVMPTSPGTVHVGLFIESGSGGLMTDLTFTGGGTGASLGNQQYTMRNLVFEGCATAIGQIWNWGWTYVGLSISNCGVGLNVSTGGSADQAVGSLTVIDSQLTNVPVGIATAFTASSSPATAGSIILENVAVANVPSVVESPDGTVLAGGTTTITAWGEGHKYVPTGPTRFQGSIAANTRPLGLQKDGGTTGAYYTRSKPQYETLPASSFLSVRSQGAKGDGVTDDTAALQTAIDKAVAASLVLFIDYGVYLVTSTLTVPPGARIVGETYPIILAGGDGGYFQDEERPRPVLQVGAFSGQAGTVELSDFVVSTRGAQAGAVLIEWNLAAPATGAPAGLWDVHTRIGGFAGSNLQVEDCPKTPGTPDAVNSNCVAAFMSMHVTEGASNLYAENVWLWTADHDIEDASNTQITVYAGRGLYVESTAGTIWMFGTAVEHHVLYQYQFVNTRDIFISQTQTETPYYQPNPDATRPFAANASLNDPDFAASCAGLADNCALAWGLRIIDSKDVLIYGSGHYSFFSNYEQTCNTLAGGESCQARILSLEGNISGVSIYNLNTIGTQSMITRDGEQMAYYADNINVFPDTVALFRSG